MNPTPEVIGLSASLISLIAGLIWKTSKAEESIKRMIADNHSLVMQEIFSLKHEIDKLSIKNENEHEKFVYKDHSINESLNHKFTRIESWISQITDHLQDKDNFLLNRSYRTQRRKN